MKIVVAGLGKIGLTVLSNLVSEGHDVVGIDVNDDVVKEASNRYDAMFACGNASDCSLMQEVGVSACELFVAVTDSDETNMLSCFLAGRMGAAHTLARIRTPEYNDDELGFLRKNLAISESLNPERSAAKEIYNILKFPSAVNIETFSSGHFEMVELVLKADSVLDGMTLAQMRKAYDAKFLVCAVQRGDEVFIPGGGFVLKGGDRIGVTASHAEITKLLRQLGILQKKARNIMILGASRTAYYLAKLLVASGNNVKIIERDKARCEEFSDAIPEAALICGDGARTDLLKEEGIRTMDAFVALTGMDEENILISYFALSQGVPKVISKVNRTEIATLSEKLGVDSIVSPRKLVGNIVTRYARALQSSVGSSVETLYRLMDGKAEALEFKVRSDFAFMEIPLRELHLKKNVLIAGIVRGGKPIIPSGDDAILPEDRVVVIASGVTLGDLADILA